MAGHKPSPTDDEKDLFSESVQDRLIEELELNDAEILVDRHDGKNATVTIGVILKIRDDSGQNVPRNSRATLSKQLTTEELARAIKSILDDLLQDCTVKYGDIKIIVKKGRLEKTVFSYSQRPGESSQHFSTV